MNKKSQLNSSNLYDELDKITKEKNKKEKEIENKKINKKNFKNALSSYSKIIMFIIVVFLVFFIKHTDNEINTFFEKYYNKFISSNITNNKTYYIGAKVVNEKNLNDVLPDIEITGTLEKERNTYMVFKYKNKIYTRKINETFDDGQFKVVNIYGNNMDIEDSSGNVFSFEQKK